MDTMTTKEWQENWTKENVTEDNQSKVHENKTNSPWRWKLTERLWHSSPGSATFNVKRAILAPFLPNKIHVEPQHIWCPNKDNTAYS